MRSRLLLIIPAFFALTGFSAWGSTFSDESAWRIAAGNYVDDNFESYPLNSLLGHDSILNLDLSLSDGLGSPAVQSASIIGGLAHDGSFVLSNLGVNFSVLTLTSHDGSSLYALGYWNVGQDDITTLTAWDEDNHVLESIVTPASANNFSFQGIVSSIPVAKFTVETTGGPGTGHGNGYYTLDDLQVAQSNAPEPSSALLLIPALAGLLYGLRRRRQYNA